MYPILIKRVYDEATEEDGYRILIDRLWPRGISKNKAKLEEWCKDIAPSNKLRKWFDHKEERFEEFKKHYQIELKDHCNTLDHILKIANKQTVTLIFAARNSKNNQAVVLQEILKNKRNI